MPRFTIVVDFRGGTYLSQVEAEGPHEATVQWAETLQDAGLDDLDEARAAIQVELATGDQLVPIEGLHCVWCVTASVDDDLVLANIIESNGG